VDGGGDLDPADLVVNKRGKGEKKWKKEKKRRRQWATQP
jgi:hypothetical protein